jgi:hypothetical protein
VERRKHGGSKRRIWRKIHIGIDEQSLEVRAAEFTTSDVGDAPSLPELLDQIPAEQEIASVTAADAFETRKCHDAIAARRAVTIIPPGKGAKAWKPDAAGAGTCNNTLRRRSVSSEPSDDDRAGITAEAVQRPMCTV